MTTITERFIIKNEQTGLYFFNPQYDEGSWTHDLEEAERYNSKERAMIDIGDPMFEETFLCRWVTVEKIYRLV